MELEIKSTPSPVLSLLDSLVKDPNFIKRVQDRWIIIEDSASRTIWSFVPNDSPAYPAVVKRQIVERNERVSLEVELLCEGSNDGCNKLAIEVKATTESFGN